MIQCRTMGQLPTGEQVHAYTLKNKGGAQAEICTLGGCLLSLHVPDQANNMRDVILGYDTLPGLMKAEGYMGCIIGRFANRIAGASFSLHGKVYSLFPNDGANHLHGGRQGFDKALWQARTEGETLLLSYVSPHGEEGYPGTLHVTVGYTLTEANALVITYWAKGDQDTPINLTNHAYFNLSGPDCPDLSGHHIQIEADHITAVSGPGCIPTGAFMEVSGTPLDLRIRRSIREGLQKEKDHPQMVYGSGYDHNFVLRDWDGTLKKAATLWDAVSGIRMEVYTDQPGVQFYSSNHIGGNVPGKRGKPYGYRQGLCLETQHFPDSVHHAHFPSTLLKKGESFTSTTEYRFAAD